MDWDKLKTFHFAAETGSLTAAAEKLGVSQSAVSRQIAALESQVGVPLFGRHARGLILTAQGEALKALTDEMAAASARADAAIADARDRVMGELRVTAPVAFGTWWLCPRVGPFSDLYPELRTHVYLDDREYDLLKLEAECALRLWPADQADLIQRKLFDVHVHLYASKDYLARRPAPASPADLDEHRIVAYKNPAAVQLSSLDWAVHLGRQDREARHADLEVNNILAVNRAVDSGFGIGALPDYITRGRDNIVRVLPEHEGPRFEAFFVYPSDLKRSRRIVAFRQFLIDQAKDWAE
ncbi:MAG TPA: LysR family transcriptional regulator [Caulobacterales bacterium]|nr:LysR family transcriptional regulator [Caulobacterales bacterium]